MSRAADPADAAPAGAPWSLARRIFLWTVVVSFSLAALAGIVVLLGADLGDTGSRILFTTLLVGAFSSAMLCCAAVFGRRERAVGVLGAAVSALTLAWSLIMVWTEGWDGFEVLGSGITVTTAFAFACLVLGLTRRRDTLLHVLLVVTMGLVAVSAALVLVAVWTDSMTLPDAFGRILGVVLILAVLSGMVTPLLAVLLHRHTDPQVRVSQSRTDPGPRLRPETAAALEAEARRRGLTVDELVAPLVRR